MSRSRIVRAAAVFVIAAAGLAPAARANIIAAVEQPAGGTRADLDVALYDATTGARLEVPAVVDTSDDELHPVPRALQPLMSGRDRAIQSFGLPTPLRLVFVFEVRF